ncbi:hypothetical protein [Dokdonella sp.]|uniref:hypothetical protein n=1 Tax=Dokdonella sp. TaxID=2291710 RepID=UPI0025BCABCB|nr:hypothetical protein [Dokdonella sp.]MBX3690614.1 hypothetical protein [Dokdonella sp.]MCW5568739.1 hypothetical protein [Dokdonella sp.]
MASLFGKPLQIFATRPRIGWETRGEGRLSVALIDNVPVAGISGPLPSGGFALAWWSSRNADASPTMELHATMEAARSRVEQVTASLMRAAA